MSARGFREKLVALINAESRENGSNTPDFILANYLAGCLQLFDGAVNSRERWYSREPSLIGEPKPTVAELEAILNSEDDTPVTINPDGSITA